MATTYTDTGPAGVRGAAFPSWPFTRAVVLALPAGELLWEQYLATVRPVALRLRPAGVVVSAEDEAWLMADLTLAGGTVGPWAVAFALAVLEYHGDLTPENVAELYHAH